MKSTTVKLKAGTIIELSFASIMAGKEKQLFGEYFPKVTPIVNSLGGAPLCSFSINDSAMKRGKPGLGALFQWPDIDAFHQLHKNPKFLAIKSIRDESLSFFTNGHFFQVDQDTEVTFEKDQFYSLIRSWNKAEIDNRNAVATLASLFSVAGSVNGCDCPNSVAINPWDDHSEMVLMEAKEHGEHQLDVFKFKLNFPPE